MRRSQVFLSALVTAALSVGVGSPGSACSVPVFRYALELWPPDDFPLVVLHRGELNAADQALVERVRQSNLANEANLRVTTVDVAGGLDPVGTELWESLEQPALDLPLLVLQTPARLGPTATVLTLELSEEHVDQLLDSPAREEISRRLLDDHSVVWVLLESGQAERDEKAFLTLSAEIARLEETLELPEPAAEDLLSAETEPLKLIFSSIRVRRDDPAERALVAMLLNVEPDLNDPEFSSEPMIFPVFGRGRALYAIVGQGIVPTTIEEAARYLTGACQCTVKAENPGADLVMAVDWDRWVVPTIHEDGITPPLGGLAGFAEATDESPLPFAGSVSTVKRADSVGSGPLAADVAPEPNASETVADVDASVVPAHDRATADEHAVAAASPAPTSASRIGGAAGPGLSAMLLVGVIGVVVVLAGVVLTRRDG
jgi:hypothetical protein